MTRKPSAFALVALLALAPTSCRETTGGPAPGASTTHAGSVKQGPVQVSGVLTPDAVAHGVQQGFERVRGCYDKGLAAQPGIAGAMFVRFTIEPSGKVTKVAITDSSVKAPALEACLVEAFGTFAFPAPSREGVDVTCPLLFSPK